MLIYRSLNGLLFFLLIVPVLSFGQFNKQLYLSDSIVIQSRLSKSVVTDINKIKDRFWVRFDYWNKEGIFIELANFESSYLFSTKDSSIATTIGALYPVSLGFILPKYSGNNKLVLFDTLNKKMEVLKLKFQTKGYRFHHNTEGLLRNSFYYDDERIIFNRSSITLNLKTENQLSRSLKRLYEKERPIVSLDLNTKEEIFLGEYPEIYRNRSFLIANHEYYFSTDPDRKYLYVSFQASDQIDKYDLKTYQKSILSDVRGKNIDPAKLLAEYKLPYEYRNSDFLNLLADSYDQIYPFSDVVIRTYRKGYNEIELKELKPPNDFNVCVNPKLKMKWFEKRLNKKMYLQQFDLQGRLMLEVSVPSNVNTFIEYDAIKEEYYFWKKTIKGNQGRAVIYVFKIKNVNISSEGDARSI